MSFVMGYVTFKNKTEAKKICTVLVKQKLIACANIQSSHLAIYEWKNKFHSTGEVSALIKTRKRLTQKVIAAIQELHSYENPCIVFFNIKSASPDFINWLNQQTETP